MIRFDAILSSAISNKNDTDFVYRFFRTDERLFYPLIVLDRGGMDLIEIHIFFRNKDYSIPSFFHYYLNRLQFKFHKTADNVIVETKICNAHLHRVTIILKRNHRYFKHQHKIFIEYYIRQRKHLV